LALRYDSFTKDISESSLTSCDGKLLPIFESLDKTDDLAFGVTLREDPTGPLWHPTDSESH
jgi:hypothetical protein